MARPKSKEVGIPIEVSMPPKLLAYLDELRDMEGFGLSRSEIIRGFVWKEVNRLIEVNRLKQK